MASVEAATLTTHFVIPARTLRDWLDHFSASGSTTAKAGTDANGGTNRQESELGWYFDPTQVRVKTWEGGQASKKGISTELKIDVSEFDEYTVSDVICLTFPMREFRVSRRSVIAEGKCLPDISFQAAISLAESWSIPLVTEFSTAGQPLSLKLEIEGIVADLTIATTENEGFRDLQAENVSSSNKPVKREIARPGLNGTVGQTGRAAGKTPMKKKNSLQFSRNAASNFPHAQAGREEADEAEVTITDQQQSVNNGRNHPEEPLFFSGGSQEAARPLSQAQLMQAASQRELDQMDPEELAGIFDDNDLDLDDNQNGESNDYDEATRPYKRPKSHSNAEEILGENLLNLGVQNESDDADDDDDEAPGTVPPAEEGSNNVSGPQIVGARIQTNSACASGHSIDHCLMNDSGRATNFTIINYETKAFIASKKGNLPSRDHTITCRMVFYKNRSLYAKRSSVRVLMSCRSHVDERAASQPR